MSITTNAENVVAATADGAKQLRAARREARDLRAALWKLTGNVAQVLDWMNAEMRAPSTPERGSRIARTMNHLELANDSIRHFTLGEPLSATGKPRPVKPAKKGKK